MGRMIGRFVGMVVLLLAASAAAAEQRIDFAKDVQPIFAKHCYSCHGPEKQKSDYRLDVRESALKGGSIGGAVVPGGSAKSALIAYVAGTHDEIRMPPKGEMLSAGQVATLRAWIDQGAKWDAVAVATAQTSWALAPLKLPAVPTVKDGKWVRTPIDAFVLAKLEASGMTPSREADRRTLIRRVTFDLTGLPPTPAEVEAFVADASPGAYEKLVDRLLASPRYGERWARHWMDVVHYAESHGNDEDKPRPNAWPYRDYLIDSFNADKPYARFAQEQLAGDVLWPGDPKAVVATAFVAVGPWDQSSQMGIMDGTIDKQVARYLDRDDMLTTTMSTFVSSTVHCARCHNHKFDPISQADYYALQAVFAGVDRIERPYDADAKVGTERRRLTALKQELEKATYPVAALLADDAQSKVAVWEERQWALASSWKTLETTDAISTQGATLKALQDGSILASGERPDTDGYLVITKPGELKSVTAFRLELLTDPSLPHGGPGRADNGNMHLSAFIPLRSDKNKTSTGPAPVIKRAWADFEQEGWPLAGALDRKPATSWAIHPQEGRGHVATFELADAYSLHDGDRLVFFLEQSQPGSHLIGRFRLSATDARLPIGGLKLPDVVGSALAVDPSKRGEAQRAILARHVLLNDAVAELAALPPQQRIYSIASDFAPQGNFKPALKPRPVEVLRRGDVRQPIGPALPGAMSCVAGLPARFDLPDANDEGARRAALARWVANRDNVLTWRSIVNRVWHYHFGRGIVETPSDFGRMGATPTHPELLDWLAMTFRDEMGGSIKRLHRLIVTSSVYRQASATNEAYAKSDGDNHLLWRMNRARLDAEEVRDAVLSISGQLDLTMGGPSARQFVESNGVHETPNADYDAFDFDSPAARRRSVYRFVFRTIPDPFMQTLDCPDASQLSPRREASVTALQALAMLNDRFVLRQSEHVAERLKREAGANVSAQVRALYRLAFGRAAEADEVTVVSEYAAKHGMANAVRMIFNGNEFMFVE